jgi:hypothetical protein
MVLRALYAYSMKQKLRKKCIEVGLCGYANRLLTKSFAQITAFLQLSRTKR